MSLIRPDSDPFNLTPTDHLLSRTRLVAMGEFEYIADDRAIQRWGPLTWPNMGFVQSPVARTPHAKFRRVSTPNEASFHNVGDTLDKFASDGAPRGNTNWIAMTTSLLREIYSEVAGHDVRHDCIDFPMPFAPISAQSYLAQRRLFETLRGQTKAGCLALEDYAIRLLYMILRAASEFWGKSLRTRSKKNAASEKRRNAAIEAAKELLALRYRENLSLQEIAENSHCSTAHLSRIFPVRTGFTIHAFQQHLRLRASLDVLRESRFDLSGIATQLGFTHHSHFTHVFHRRFGITPSEFVQSKSRTLHDDFLRLLEHDAPSRNHPRRFK